MAVDWYLSCDTCKVYLWLKFLPREGHDLIKYILERKEIPPLHPLWRKVLEGETVGLLVFHQALSFVLQHSGHDVALVNDCCIDDEDWYKERKEVKP